MMILVLIALLALLPIILSLPLFEVVFAFLLLLPLSSYPFLIVGLQPDVAYGIAFVLQTGLLVFWSMLQKKKVQYSFDFLGEFLPFLLFFFVFFFCYHWTLSWPDFINLGERLRDYALLQSVLQNPVIPEEPWMSGYILSYYVYWYRLAAFFHTAIGLEPWLLYHQLQSFTFALFFVSLYLLGTRFLRFSRFGAFCSSVVIAFGSNLAGLFWAIAQERERDVGSYWAPSRIMNLEESSGPITEFPVWSFLLGDLHPHFLNLCLVPFILYLGLRFARTFPAERGAVFLAALFFFPVWIYGANAWEVPVYLLVLASLMAVSLYSWRWRRKEASPSPRKVTTIVQQYFVGWRIFFRGIFLGEEGVFEQRRLLVATIAFLFLAALMSIGNLSGNDGYPLRWIGIWEPKTERTLLVEALRHWGFPLLLIAGAFPFLLRTSWWKLLSGLTAMVLVLVPLGYFTWAGGMIFTVGLAKKHGELDWISHRLPTNSALLLFGLLLLFLLVRVVQDFRSGGLRKNRLSAILGYSLGLSSLLVLIFPELFYFDDPYGQNIERMNTIFKFYSAAWFLLHLFAFWLLAAAFRKYNEKRTPFAQCFAVFVQILVVFGGVSFFAEAVEQRAIPGRHEDPLAAEGLTSLDAQYPGLAATVRLLREREKGTVLEAQGSAYSLTAHVATLSGQPSFLGWRNHLDLLLGEYQETKRRSTVTDFVYSERSCSEKRKTLQREGIRYVVVGPLEVERYPHLVNDAFPCLKTMSRVGLYRVLERR